MKKLLTILFTGIVLFAGCGRAEEEARKATDSMTKADSEAGLANKHRKDSAAQADSLSKAKKMIDNNLLQKDTLKSVDTAAKARSKNRPK